MWILWTFLSECIWLLKMLNQRNKVINYVILLQVYYMCILTHCMFYVKSSWKWLAANLLWKYSYQLPLGITFTFWHNYIRDTEDFIDYHTVSGQQAIYSIFPYPGEGSRERIWEHGKCRIVLALVYFSQLQVIKDFRTRDCV